MGLSCVNGLRFRNFLWSAFGCFAVALLLMGFWFFVSLNKPSLVEESLLTTRGVFLAVSSNTQYSSTFIVKEDSGLLVKFLVLPSYVKFRLPLETNIGKGIEVEHYGRLVVGCSVDGVKVCVSNCLSASECSAKAYNAKIATLRRMIITLLFVGIVFLLIFICKNKGGER
ncbi:hypothetical protein [Pseudomonas sp. TWR1-1-3]|uniref:hypothetical protein n=1 Tax=Pseudomonas sp. TWR1-1-3 TaxID=2804624 RepID=UPI003CF030FA